MTKEIIILILFLTILFLTYKINKKKVRNLFYKSKIKQIDISELDKIFDEKLISKNLKGPKEDTIIKSFIISPQNKIVGMTSDYEAWIISALCKKSNNIFEFVNIASGGRATEFGDSTYSGPAAAAHCNAQGGL